jgi:two-component system, response regulator PdtaR
MSVVLVVESDALIRMSAVHMVEDSGFEAVPAHNAEEAIRVLESLSDIRAVFTGINMSGSMNGLRLARAIRDRWPPMHVILASGRDAPGGEKFPANWRFVRKPYTFEQVAKALRELLGPNPAMYRIIGGANHIHGSVV